MDDAVGAAGVIGRIPLWILANNDTTSLLTHFVIDIAKSGNRNHGLRAQ